MSSVQIKNLVRKSDILTIWSVAGVLLLFLIWAGLTELDKVTRAAGRVVPQQQNQMVQHFEGGIISEILVKEGDQVQQGQTLMRIENSFWRAELQQTQLELASKRVRALRLNAEASGSSELRLPADLVSKFQGQAEREISIFNLRRESLSEQLAIVGEQIRQKEFERSEVDARWTNTIRERELAQERLANLQRLQGIGAVSRNEVLENERVLQQIDTRLSDISHEVPRIGSALTELSRRRQDIFLRFRGDAEKERSATELEIAKLQEQIGAMLDRNLRSDVGAPITGIINKLYVTTVGGVVRSGEPLVQLVPRESKVVVEARLAPIDRADVWPGLPAVIKVSAYDYTRFGGLVGRVIDISPDAFQDERGATYFRLRLEADVSRFGPEKPVVPGMTADIDIISGRRTILAALIRPLRVVQDRALRQ